MYIMYVKLWKEDAACAVRHPFRNGQCPLVNMALKQFAVYHIFLSIESRAL